MSSSLDSSSSIVRALVTNESISIGFMLLIDGDLDTHDLSILGELLV
jgi:hypothetical protein